MTQTLPPVAAQVDLPRPALEVRRRTGGARRQDVYALVGSALAALALSTALYALLAPFDGRLGYVVTTWAAFVAIYALVVSADESGPAVRDRLATVVVTGTASLLLLALVSVVGFTVWRGRQALGHLNFFTQDMASTGPLDPLTSGGLVHAAIGTLEQITIALVIVVPLGLLTAVFLSEVPGPFARFVRTISEAMTALPSIVCGLFIYATVILALGNGKSGVAASLALSVMMLPIVVRAADVVLRLVPAPLKEASLALGAGQWRTVWHVTLPTARSGLATAVILGAARGIGETSPVLLTAGSNAARNADPFSGPQVSLPLAVFEFVRSPQPTMIARGFGTATTLLVLVLVLFFLARLVGGTGPGSQTRRQQRAAGRASDADAARFATVASGAPLAGTAVRPDPSRPRRTS